ncbi:MAG: hypothetical protein JWO62_1146 [Acidimicrobiaceae bacterium]|nr:hypothetical protein [Acidimicrobiaceae bacterium]
MTCVWTAGVEGGPAPAPRAAELATAAVRLAAAHYRALLSAVAIVLVPSVLVGAAALGYWRSVSDAHGATSGLARLAEVVGILAVVLGNFFAQAAGVHAATSAAVGAKPDWRASCRAAVSRRGAVVGSGLAVAALAGLGLALFVIPGIVLWLTLYVTMPVVVMEGAGVRSALRRSASLVAGRRLTILGAFLLVEVVVLACSLPLGAVAGALFSHSHSAAVVAEQVAAYAVEVLLTPLQVALVLIIYLDLRARHDGARPDEIARAAGIFVPLAPAMPAGWSAGAAPSPWSSDTATLHDRVPPDHSREPEVGGEQPTHGPGSPGWPAVSPKPSPDGPRRQQPASSWPGVSPKPPPPSGRAAPRPVPDMPERSDVSQEPERPPPSSESAS